MMSRIRYSLILLLLQGAIFSFGQEHFLNTRAIGMEEGLSHYKVLSFYPDKDGMWIGTGDGLNYYDGYNWKYWTKDEGQLRSTEVNAIHQDQDDLLWLFSTKNIDERNEVLSIDILDSSNDSICSFEQKLEGHAPFEIEAIQNFFEDQEHQLYFFANNQLWKYTPSSLFELVALPEGFKPQNIFADGSYAGSFQNKLAICSAEGKLFTTSYTVTDKGYRIVGNRQKFWVHQDQIDCSVFVQQKNGTYAITPFPVQPKNQNFYLLCFDENRQHLWVSKGLVTYLYDNNENVLNQIDRESRRACLDDNGNLWIGKMGVELLRLQKRKFKQFLHFSKEKVANKDFYKCRGLLEVDGKLYVNSYKGTKIIDLENGHILESPLELEVNFGILKDRNSNLWMAHKSLFQLDESGTQIVEKYSFPEPLPRIWSLFEDRENKLWMGHLGLSYLEKGELKPFENYNAFTELKEALVQFFYKDKNGVIWVISNKGLFQLDLEKGIIAKYGKNRPGAFRLPSNKFQHMYQDAHGVFWLTTEDAGLLRWDKASGDLQQFDKTKGMPANNIYAVYEDDYDFLWLSSFNGLIRFQKETQQITVYTEEDGICDDEFNRISHFQAADGYLYFGGQNGVTGFHPKDFLKEKSNQKEFELAVKHISIFGLREQKDTLADGSKINLLKLSSGAKVIDLEIVGSDLFWADKFNLHYSLKQFDKSRKTLTNYREKISADNHVELFGMYTGNYVLQVKAIQKNRNQLGKTIELNINIAKPIYHKPLFWLGIIIAVFLGIWLYIKLKTARMHQRQVELETLVTERTNQILKGQKIIKTQSEEIEVMKGQLHRKEELWLEQFQAIINERLGDPNLDLPHIIDSMEIGRSAFYEKVKSLTSLTPNQYIQELRLNKAKTLLEEGDVRTVKEVAYSVGIKRPSYFSKLYKERFGILPSSYFRDHRN